MCIVFLRVLPRLPTSWRPRLSTLPVAPRIALRSRSTWCNSGVCGGLDQTATECQCPWPSQLLEWTCEAGAQKRAASRLGQTVGGGAATLEPRLNLWPDGEVQLGELMLALHDDKTLRPFYLQLLWQLGQRLQALMAKSMRNIASSGSRSAQQPLVVHARSMDETLQDATQLDIFLVAYVLGSREASAGRNNVSMCTDKASVGGLGGGVQCTVFVLQQTNHAILAVPQVGPPN